MVRDQQALRSVPRGLVCCVLVALASCGGDVDHTPGAADTPVLTIPPDDAIESAGIVGPLTLTGGCLYVDASEGGLGAVIFSYGTTWDPVTSSVVNPDGSSVAVDQTLAASGGGHDIADLSGWPLADGDARTVQRCAESAGVTRFFIVGNVAISD